MAIFHRLAVPTYFGGLPASYDYLNTPTDPSVGGSGVPALVDTIKSGGTNDGTYFVAFTEDGLSKAVNRGLAALALNTDFIDSVLRTSIPKIVTQDATAVGAVTTHNLVGEIFVGENGMANNATNRNLLIHVTEQSTNDDLEVGGTKIAPLLIHDGASTNVVGTQVSGFRTNASVNFSPAIPNGTAYRVWYGIRSSLLEVSQTEKGAYFKNTIRTAEHISGTARSLFRQLHSEAAVNQAYNAAFDSTIRSLASAGLNERYRRSTTQPAGFVTGDYNVAGGGRAILRDGGAVEVRAASIDLTAVQYPDAQLAGIRTVTNVSSRTLTGFSATKGGDLGFVHETDSIKHDSAIEAVRDAFCGPGFVDLVPKDIRAATTGGDNVLTFINPTATASLNPDSINDANNRRTIQCAAGQYFRNTGQTSIRIFVDLIEVVFSGRAPETYIIDTIVSDTRIRVRRLNGDTANIFPSAVTNCTIRWLQPGFFAGGSANTIASPVGPWGNARFMVLQPAQLTDDPTNEKWPEPAGFYAALSFNVNDGGYTALQWGAASVFSMGGALPLALGKLRGDGDIDCIDIRATTLDASDVNVGDDLIVTDQTTLNKLTMTGVGIFGAASSLTLTAGGTATQQSGYNITFNLDSMLANQTITYRVPLHACYVEQDGITFEDGWTLTRGVAPGVWVQQLVSPSSGAQIFFPLRVEPGDIINSITMVFDGRVGSAGAHAGLPAQQPDLTLVIGPDGTDVATVQDAQVSQANYEVAHNVVLSGGVFPYTVLNFDYFIRVNGERSTNAANNTAGIKSISATIVRKKVVSTTFV